jgi:hypothetical protein
VYGSISAVRHFFRVLHPEASPWAHVSGVSGSGRVPQAQRVRHGAITSEFFPVTVRGNSSRFRDVAGQIR